MGSLDPFIMREAYAEQINFVGEHSWCISQLALLYLQY